MRFGIFILAAGLLVGCGGQKQSAVDQCYTDLSVYENFSSSAASFDRSKAEALARTSCAPVLISDDGFKSLVLKRFEATVPNADSYQLSEFDITHADRYHQLVADAVQDFGDRKELNTYSISLNLKGLEWDERFYNIGELK